MKVLVNCELWFSQDIDAGKLSDATSGPIFGDHATFKDIECSPQHGQVGIATLVGYFENPTRKIDEEFEDEISEMVGDIVYQYGFPVEEVKSEILDFCDA